jgi:hypothetical protein
MIRETLKPHIKRGQGRRRWTSPCLDLTELRYIEKIYLRWKTVDGGSSNGRTLRSGRSYRGSSPCPPAKIQRLIGSIKNCPDYDS